MHLSKRIMTQSKNFQNFNVGEQFSRKVSQREFPSQKQNVLINFERMKIDENCQRTNYRGEGESNGDVIYGLGRHL
jgi:hypothetical protein